MIFLNSQKNINKVILKKNNLKNKLLNQLMAFVITNQLI